MAPSLVGLASSSQPLGQQLDKRPREQRELSRVYPEWLASTPVAGRPGGRRAFLVVETCLGLGPPHPWPLQETGERAKVRP